MFDYRSSQSLRRWLLLSLTGFIISTAAILSWIIYFQITAKSWDVNYLVYFPAPPYNSTNSTSQTSIDAREQLTCNNIKAAGVTLYTVQVNTGGDPTSTLLQNCASDSSKFFLLKSATAMVTTFSTIGTQLSNLRVAK